MSITSRWSPLLDAEISSSAEEEEEEEEEEENEVEQEEEEEEQEEKRQRKDDKFTFRQVCREKEGQTKRKKEKEW